MSHAALVAGSLFACAAASAASLPERVRENCATEISMICAGRKDAATCLNGQRDALTARCRNALSGESRPAAEPQVSRARDAAAGSNVAVPPPGAAAVPGVGNVWFKDDYSGPRPGLYSKFRDAVGAETPRALQEIAKLMGQSSYRAAFPRPLVFQVEYDPTQQRGLASLDSTGNGGVGQSVTFNLAYWEECPSQPILRSVVTHEVAHAVLHDLVGEAGMAHVPQWFDEGLGMLAGGEPFAGLSLNAAYYRHGRGYPGELPCRLENEGSGLNGIGLITDCYPYYLLAVRHVAESSPDALPRVIADLKSGIVLQKSISARLGVPWNAFEEAVDKRVRRTFNWMSPLSRLTGRGWWRQVRWCRR